MKIPIPTRGDSADWGEHDPYAATIAHDPTLEPWASMTRDELRSALEEAKSAAEYDLIQEFIMDKMTTKELEVMNHIDALALFLIKEWKPLGPAQTGFLVEVAMRAAAEIRDNMPAMGAPQDCN